MNVLIRTALLKLAFLRIVTPTSFDMTSCNNFGI